MDKNYQSHIAESKDEYHKNRVKMSFEDKVKVIVELQKIEAEFIKNNKTRSTSNKYRRIWEIQF